MDIGIYIADLLRNQDEVSLPGLGTFTKERVAASYDQTSNSFRPPSYRVSFSNKLSDFNSLSDYISVKKNLSPSSAEYFIKKFTSAISDMLQAAGTAEVKPLGIIRQKNEDLTFETAADFEITGSFYGLKPVIDLKNLASPAVKDAVIPAFKEDSIEDFITSQHDEEIEDEEVYVEETRSNRTLFTVLGAFLFAVIAAALLYLFNPATQNLVDSLLPGYVSTISAVPDSANVNNTSAIAKTADSLNSIQPTVVQDSNAVDPSANAVPVEKVPEPAVETTTIEIIGAAFGKRSEAESYIKTMKAKGMQARILENMPGPLFKVSLASFPDQQSAQKELNRIIKEVEKEAWTTPYKSKQTQ